MVEVGAVSERSTTASEAEKDNDEPNNNTAKNGVFLSMK
jgi:hypothetical protein